MVQLHRPAPDMVSGDRALGASCTQGPRRFILLIKRGGAFLTGYEHAYDLRSLLPTPQKDPVPAVSVNQEGGRGLFPNECG